MDMTFSERYEYLRKSHPFTSNNFKIQFLENIDELIIHLKKERQIFNNFITNKW